MPEQKESDPVDIPRRLGAAAVGGRLRRLSERIDEDCARIYAEHGIDFEQRWLNVMYVLTVEGPQPVGRLAAMIGISHASVSESRKSLQKAGLILAETDTKDARTVHLRLSTKGKKLFERMRPVMEVLMRVSAETNEEAGRPLEAIERMEAALKRQSIYDRFQALAEATHKTKAVLGRRIE